MSNDALDRLVENHLRNKITRREFLIRCLATGLSTPVALSLLSACNVVSPSPQQAGPTAPPASTSAPAAATPRKGGSLVYGIHNELQPMDWDTPWFPEIAFSDIYEYLTAIDPNTGELVPYLAESFDVAPDGLKLTYKLRKDKVSHSGNPITAQNVKAQLDWWNGPESDFPEAYFKNVASVDTPDDYTVVFNMKGVDTQALWGTAYSFAPVVDMSVRQANREAWGKSIAVGTGPYKFVSWEGDSAISERFDGYFGAPAFMKNQGPGHLDRITYTWLPDQSTRSINLEAGDFDIIEQPAPQDVARLEANPDLAVIKRPAISILYLGFNFKSSLTGDRAVREAIARSVDRNIIIDKVMFGLANAATSPVPPHDVAYWKDSETLYPYDPKKAKEVLEEAGWAMGANGVREKDGQTLEPDMIILSTSEQKTVGEVIQEQLSKVGIKVNLEVLDKGTHQQRLLDGQEDMHFFRYVYDSPIAVLKILYDTNYTVPNGANWSFYSSPEADKWFESFNTTPDPEKRIEAIINAQKVLMHDVAQVPIYNPIDIWAMRKWVQGFMVNPYAIYSLHNDLWVSEDSPRA